MKPLEGSNYGSECASIPEQSHGIVPNFFGEFICILRGFSLSLFLCVKYSCVCKKAVLRAGPIGL